jgi:hypothetical protein
VKVNIIWLVHHFSGQICMPYIVCFPWLLLITLNLSDQWPLFQKVFTWSFRFRLQTNQTDRESRRRPWPLRNCNNLFHIQLKIEIRNISANVLTFTNLTSNFSEKEVKLRGFVHTSLYSRYFSASYIYKPYIGSVVCRKVLVVGSPAQLLT